MPVETSMYGQQPSVKLDPGAAISQAQGMQSLKAGQFDLITKQMGQLNSYLGTMANDASLTPDKIMSTTDMLVRQGLITPEQRMKAVSDLPPSTGNPQQDIAANQNWAKQHLFNSIGNLDKLHQMYGQPTAYNDGATQHYLTVSPTNGIVNQGQIPNQLSPEFRAGTQTAPMGPDMQPRQETRGAAAEASGYRDAPSGLSGPAVRNPLISSPAAPVRAPVVNRLTGAVAPVAPVAAAPIAPPAPPPLSMAGGAKLGDRTDFNTTVAISNPPPQPGPPGRPQEPRVMGPAVGSGEAATRTAAASADNGIALERSSDTSTERKATIQNMEDHLKNITTGPMSSVVKTVGGAINQAAAIGGMDPIVRNQGEREQFDKLSATLQRQNATLGVASDAGLANAGASTPNSSLTKEGIQGMLATAKGNEDAIRVKNSEWQKWKDAHGAASYGAFQQQFQAQFEPRAFAIPYMDKKAAADMIQGMAPAERAKVASAFELAHSRGWIKTGGQ